MNDDRWQHGQKYMQHVRRDLFGSEEPPFESDAEAVRWVKAESAQGLTDEREAQKVHLGSFLDRQWKEFMTELQADHLSIPPGCRVTGASIRALLVKLPGEGEYVDKVLAATDSLDRISEECERLARFFGCPDWEATLALLAGRRPVLTGPKVRQQVFQDFNPVGILPRTLAIEASTEGYAPPHRIARVWEHHSMMDKDRAFVEVIDHLGPPPRPAGRGNSVGAREYWERVCAVWNARPDCDLHGGTLNHHTSARSRYLSVSGRNPGLLPKYHSRPGSGREEEDDHGEAR